jgi:hypothetical protein
MTGTEQCRTAGAATHCASFLLAEADFTGRYATPSEGIRTVLPHEAFHAVQNAYDAAMDRYWAEGTAQWAAKRIDPSLTDLERALPAFFREAGRAIDVPPGGVTAGFLYGAAIWPVFLSQFVDDDVVREAFEAEGAQGGTAIAAVESALRGRGVPFDDAWVTFWTWNSSTGARAEVPWVKGAGYTEGARYPLVPLQPFAVDAGGVTSGRATYLHDVPRGALTSQASDGSGAATESGGQVPRELSLQSPGGEHRGVFVPLEAGQAKVTKALALPVTLGPGTEGGGIVVVTSLSDSKRDAPYTLSVRAVAAADTASDGAMDGRKAGCTVAGSTASEAHRAPWAFLTVFALAPWAIWRRRRARCAGRGRAERR